MYYQKIKSGETIIEFHNNWLGVETIIVNGQIVSKKSSIMGTNHYFTLMEDGHIARYILTTKVNDHFQVLIDLHKDGELIEEDVVIRYGTKPKAAKNTFKQSGITKLTEYDIEEGMADLEKGLVMDAKDPEIYFYLACGYSIQEKAKDGFECIKKAVEYQLQNTEMILEHDMMAYLRMQEGFEEFLDSNFTEYDITKLPKEEEEDDNL